MSLANFFNNFFDTFQSCFNSASFASFKNYTFIDFCIFKGLNKKLMIQKLQNVQSIGSYEFREWSYLN